MSSLAVNVLIFFLSPNPEFQKQDTEEKTEVRRASYQCFWHLRSILTASELKCAADTCSEIVVIKMETEVTAITAKPFCFSIKKHILKQEGHCRLLLFCAKTQCDCKRRIW